MAVDPEWIELGTSDKKTYYYDSRGGLWRDHQERAQAYGGNLVCLNSENEYNNVVNLLRAQNIINVWIGLTDDPVNVDGAYEYGKEGWRWMDGTEVTYDKWDTGEPNNYAGGEHVAWMVGYDYKWNDLTYSHSAWGAVIEIRKPTVEINGVKYVVDAMAGINLAGADLTGLDLTGANLVGSVLTGANLTNAKLEGADLTGVKSGNIIGNPTLDSNYSLVSGYIIGPGVDLTDVDLTGANLVGADLTGANLSNVTLTDADLRLANLSGANMTNVTIGESTTPLPPLQFVKKDLRNRSIQNVKISSLENSIIDSTTNFAGANLTNVDFSNVIFKDSPGARANALANGQWTDEELIAIGWTA